MSNEEVNLKILKILELIIITNDVNFETAVETLMKSETYRLIKNSETEFHKMDWQDLALAYRHEKKHGTQAMIDFIETRRCRREPLDYSNLTDEEVQIELKKGYKDIQEGRWDYIDEAFENIWRRCKARTDEEETQ